MQMVRDLADRIHVPHHCGTALSTSSRACT
jgi:hypothetical protein